GEAIAGERSSHGEAEAAASAGHERAPRTRTGRDTDERRLVDHGSTILATDAGSGKNRKDPRRRIATDVSRAALVPTPLQSGHRVPIGGCARLASAARATGPGPRARAAGATPAARGADGRAGHAGHGDRRLRHPARRAHGRRLSGLRDVLQRSALDEPTIRPAAAP